MEATGVDWKPVWHILEDGPFELLLANAAHVKNVPGRKTDVSDAAWLADLLAHGLIRASFVPDAATQELRALLRTRKQLVREQARHVQRLQKTLEDANIKLESVLSDVVGVSGRAMLAALIAGASDPEALAALAHPRLKATPAALKEALHGRVTRHHRFLLRLHLQQIDALETAIAAIDQEIAGQLAPFRAAVQRLDTIPGVNALAAEIAGKRRSTRLRKGAPWLKPLLTQCAWAARRKTGSYLRAQFHRLRARRGARRLADLGYAVEISPLPEAA